jgi:hypothetical protein
MRSKREGGGDDETRQGCGAARDRPAAAAVAMLGWTLIIAGLGLLRMGHSFARSCGPVFGPRRFPYNIFFLKNNQRNVKACCFSSNAPRPALSCPCRPGQQIPDRPLLTPRTNQRVVQHSSHCKSHDWSHSWSIFQTLIFFRSLNSFTSECDVPPLGSCTVVTN